MPLLDDLWVNLSMRGMSAFNADVGQIRKQITSIKNATSYLGYGGTFTTAGLGAMLAGGFVKAAADMERAKANLSRFVPDAGFGDLTKELDQMSARIPVAIQKIYGIGGAVAQVGVTGTPAIVATTEAIAKMSVISEMAADDVAKNFAKIGAVMNLPASMAPNIGSLIIGRANASAGDPAEIIALTQTMSGMGAAAHMTLPEIVAIAATIKDSGMTAEKATSQFTNIMTHLQEAPEDFAKLLNTTTSEFKKLRDANPFDIMIKSFEAVRDQPDAENQLAALHLMGAHGIRGNQMVQIIPMLEKAREHAREGKTEFTEAKALDAQFAKMSDTTYKSLEKLSNAFSRLGDKINQMDLNVIRGGANLLSDMSNKFVEGGFMGGPKGEEGFLEALIPPYLKHKYQQMTGLDDESMKKKDDAERAALKTPEQKQRFDDYLRLMGRMPPLTDREKAERVKAKELAPFNEKNAAERKAAEAGVDKAEAQLAIAKEEEKIYKDAFKQRESEWKDTVGYASTAADKFNKSQVDYMASITSGSSEGEVARKKAARDKALDEHQTAEIGVRIADKTSMDKFDEWTAAIGRTTKALENSEIAKAKLAVVPGGAEAAKAKDLAEKAKSIITQEGGRKFAFDELIDPQGMNRFRLGAASLPDAIRKSAAGVALGEKMGAAHGVDVAKNITEDQVARLAQQRGNAIGAVAQQVAQEKIGRLYAKPVFQTADEAWKRVASGAMEGDPMTRILKENARSQKEVEKATKALETAVTQGFASIKDNMVIFSGNP